MRHAYILNASPLSMFPANHRICADWHPVTTDEVRHLLATWVCEGIEIISAIGHADIAAVLTQQIDYPLNVQRVSVQLSKDDYALVCQYTGPRLPEGATQLPSNAALSWYWLRYWHALPINLFNIPTND